MLQGSHDSSHPRLRALILAIALLAASLVVSLPHSAAAEPGFTTDILFYNNSNEETIVGWKHFDCDGSSFFWGASTPYYTIIRDHCPPP
jgi:hypothetical protein